MDSKMISFHQLGTQVLQNFKQQVIATTETGEGRITIEVEEFNHKLSSNRIIVQFTLVQTYFLRDFLPKNMLSLNHLSTLFCH